KRATRANPPFAEVAEVRFFCFFFLVKKSKVLKVLCILVIRMEGFVGRANSLAEHTLDGHKLQCAILYVEVIAGQQQKCDPFVPHQTQRFTYEYRSLSNTKSAHS